MRITQFKNIPVESAYQEAINALALRFGRKQKDVAQRLIGWLISQPPEIQASFLGTPGSKLVTVEIDPEKPLPALASVTGTIDAPTATGPGSAAQSPADVRGRIDPDDEAAGGAAPAPRDPAPPPIPMPKASDVIDVRKQGPRRMAAHTPKRSGRVVEDGEKK